MVAVNRGSSLKLHRRPLLIDLNSLLHIHIDTYAKHNVTDVSRIPD
ncbi:hypothetical protein VO64_2436 [Pseudomonas synxantha]|uniref:Uncharacterized protein n=1 Tax=Pseudomonas synxantha TaxID=47883 RepID=A0AAU8TL37_9PSED|nr:hypothetical protein VO64_2436 [Pseudomonas synxantha]